MIALKHISSGWRPYLIASVAGVGLSVVAAMALTYLSPLATHRVNVPLNSASVTTPVPLEGLSDLPKLLARGDARQPWAIVGGALLQAGFTRLSIPALEQAVARDTDNNTLHVALGEALALADGGLISERAKAEFELALRADPNDMIARFYMGHWLLQNGKAKPALVKWVGLMRTVGNDQTWYSRLWAVMPAAAQEVGINELALQALCTAGM